MFKTSMNVKVPIPVERSQPVWTLLVDSAVLVWQERMGTGVHKVNFDNHFIIHYATRISSVVEYRKD